MRAHIALLCLVASTASGQAAGPLSPPNEASAERSESMCKIAAQEQNLSGASADASVQACVTQQSPDFGYWEHCRQSARKRHLTKAKLADAVTFCMSRRQ